MELDRRPRNSERFNYQVLAIEDAQTRIKAFCKQAAEQMYTESEFRRGVFDIINELLEVLESVPLKEKAVPALWRFALRMYIQYKRLIEVYATFFAILSIAKAERARDADKYYRAYTNTVSPELRKTPLFRSVKLDIPDSAYNKAVPLGTYSETYMKMVEKLTAELVASDAKEDYSSSVSLRNIAEMTIRYEYNLKQIDDFRQNGTKLVYIVPHANCSKRCEKYQVGGTSHPSGLYSLDGTTGKTPEGVPYRPLEFATNNEDDIYRTKAGRVYQNGCLTGFNCRHTLKAYKPGNKPIPIPAEVIERQRKIEQTQRQYERRIRDARSAEVLLWQVNKKEYEKARKASKRLYDEYKEYSQKHNVAYIPARTRIIDYDIQRARERQARFS